MLENIYDYLEDKEILILGFGREGQSTYKFIRKRFPDNLIGIADKNELDFAKHNYLKSDNAVQFHCGNDYLNALQNYDIIIKSPGISLKGFDVDSIRNKLTSQSDLFLKYFNRNIIGITGTKGKSTTSSLIKHILDISNNNVRLIGNIGIPPFDVLEDINSSMTIIFELSSHQLEHVNHSPHISILLNIYEEHLDHYNSYADYQIAKANIFKFQKKEDVLIYNADNDLTNYYVKALETKQVKYPFSFARENIKEYGTFIEEDFINYVQNTELNKIYNINTKRSLIGKHNLNNIMAAITACKILHIKDSDIVQGIGSFEPLPHRMEYVGKFDNIHFYNDSIATIPEATINAIESLKKVNTLIVGGFDRGINYKKLATYLVNSDIQNLIFLPATGNIIWQEMQEIKQGDMLSSQVHFVSELTEAVELAKRITAQESICLFSPAAASYGYFLNFEHRGNAFKELVKEVKVK